MYEGEKSAHIKFSTDVVKYIKKYNLNRDTLKSYIEYLDTILVDYPVRRTELIVTPAIDDRQRLRYIIYVAKNPVDIEIEIADRFIERFPDEEFVDFSIGVRRDHA